MLSRPPLSLFPRAFLLFFPLHLGTELIIALGALNKASGFYGFLALFNGHPVSAVEWVLNALSLVFLPVFVITLSNFSKRNALQMVLFAYVYTIDTFASVGFAIYFCVHWFVEKAAVVAASGSASDGGVSSLAAASASTAGSLATAPVTEVADSLISAAASTASSALSTVLGSTTELSSASLATVTATASSSLSAATATVSTGLTSALSVALPSATDISPEFREALAEGAARLASRASDAVADANAISKAASLAQETSVTIVITVGILFTRLYFNLVVLAYARQLVQQQNLRPHNHNGAAQGTWASRVQRIALSIFPSFWNGFSGYSAIKASSVFGKQEEAQTSLNSDFDDDRNEL